MINLKLLTWIELIETVHNCVKCLFQALFSIAQWPNSMKLFWAPIVDAFYFPWIGRRKTWLHPIQYLEGTVNCIFNT